MMKGTPCSRGNYAPLKTSSKTCISVEVQGLGPWRGLGQRPNLGWALVAANVRFLDHQTDRPMAELGR